MGLIAVACLLLDYGCCMEHLATGPKMLNLTTRLTWILAFNAGTASAKLLFRKLAW